MKISNKKNTKEQRSSYVNFSTCGQNTNQCYSANLFDKKIWRVEDVADFLGCSVGHVYNLTSDEKIPKVKKGKFVYFIPDEILNWILEGNL